MTNKSTSEGPLTADLAWDLAFLPFDDARAAQVTRHAAVALEILERNCDALAVEIITNRHMGPDVIAAAYRECSAIDTMSTEMVISNPAADRATRAKAISRLQWHHNHSLLTAHLTAEEFDEIGRRCVCVNGVSAARARALADNPDGKRSWPELGNWLRRRNLASLDDVIGTSSLPLVAARSDLTGAEAAHVLRRLAASTSAESWFTKWLWRVRVPEDALACLVGAPEFVRLRNVGDILSDIARDHTSVAAVSGTRNAFLAAKALDGLRAYTPASEEDVEPLFRLTGPRPERHVTGADTLKRVLEMRWFPPPGLERLNERQLLGFVAMARDWEGSFDDLITVLKSL